jgi:hypothetical protein
MQSPNDQLQEEIDQIVIRYNTRKSEILNNISSLEDEMNTNQGDIDTKNSEIQLKQRRVTEQQKEINTKEGDILVRNRMLQIAQEKNIYKQKIVYSLIAIIMLLLGAGAAAFMMGTKKRNNSNA